MLPAAHSLRLLACGLCSAWWAGWADLHTSQKYPPLLQRSCWRAWLHVSNAWMLRRGKTVSKQVLVLASAQCNGFAKQSCRLFLQAYK